MKLDPYEKEMLESFERGEWKPTNADEVGRMREFARQQLRANVRAGFESARAEGRVDDHAVGPRPAQRIKKRGRVP